MSLAGKYLEVIVGYLTQLVPFYSHAVDNPDKSSEVYFGEQNDFGVILMPHT